MAENAEILISRLNKKVVFPLVFIAVVAVTLSTIVRFNLTGFYEGIFLLRGEDGAMFEFQDDLYLGQEGRYIAGMDFGGLKEFLGNVLNKHRGNEPYLHYEWNKKRGNGFVVNYLPGRRQIRTCFSRFENEFRKEDAGLFVGGGLPADIGEDNRLMKSATGMAYYDGTRWFHVWCNANEALFNSKAEPIYPHDWTYLGSKIIHKGEKDLILESKHRVTIDGVPLRIKRYAFFRAGATYFLLSFKITNIGNIPVTYNYLYGDDPWLGDFGTSAGNVGWAADGLHYYAGGLDTNKNHYAGYFDYGNDIIGEGHNFKGIANFIEWFGVEPSFVYFSNGPFDKLPITNELIPLQSNARFIGLNWYDQTLQRGQTKIYTLAIGMADLDPRTGFPKKPEINMKNFP
jgi:hypothetical protein